MSSTNQGPEYFSAEKKYLAAQDMDEKIHWLREMIRNFKKHKGSEKMQAELKNRLRRLIEKQEKTKKSAKGKKGIRKEGYQVALIGKTNSGKSLLLSRLTNAKPVVSDVAFTTHEPELGTMDFQGVKAQIVDLPSIGGKEFDYSIVNNADCLLVVVHELGDVKEVEGVLDKAIGKKIVVVNKTDLLNEHEKRKLDQRMRAKRIKNYVLVSAKSGEGIDELKGMILGEMGVIRIFTKEPGKPVNKDPVVLKEGSSVKDVAETIYKGFSRQVKETRLTGPSGKFAHQRVGMHHVLKDMDVVEFKT